MFLWYNVQVQKCSLSHLLKVSNFDGWQRRIFRLLVNNSDAETKCAQEEVPLRFALGRRSRGGTRTGNMELSMHCRVPVPK